MVVHIKISKPLIRITGWHTPERERHKESEKEGGRMQCFMKKEGKSLIDVENVETMAKGGAI